MYSHIPLSLVVFSMWRITPLAAWQFQVPHDHHLRPHTVFIMWSLLNHKMKCMKHGCARRLKLVDTVLKCVCGGVFCEAHRFFGNHDCPRAITPSAGQQDTHIRHPKYEYRDVGNNATY